MAETSKRSRRQGGARVKRAATTHAQRGTVRLRESSEQFRFAQEALGIVTWIWDLRSDRVQWYGDASLLLGLAPKTFSGRFSDYLKHLHPDDVEAAKRTFVDCLKGRRPQYRAAERVLWPDGSAHWLETYGRAEYGDGGRAVRMAGVIKEITERKKQESARLKAEKQLLRVFDASPDYIVIVRAGDGKFIAANPAFERITGYREAEIIGRTVDDLKIWATPGERPRFLAELQQTGTVRDRPVLLRTRSGNTVSGRMSASLVEHEGEQLVISLMHDVTEVKQLERRADSSERKYAALFASNPEAVIITRVRDAVILEVNAAWERYSGYRRDQVLGRSAIELRSWVRPDDRAAAVAQLESKGGVSNVETRFLRADGAEIDALLSAARIEIEGETCAIWTWRDVSEQRKQQLALRESEARFRALTALSADWYWEQDEHFRFVWQPGADSRLEGYRPPRYIGLTRWEAHPDSLGAEQWAAHRAQLEAHQSFRDLEFSRLSADGVMRWVSVSGYPIFDDKGAFRGYRGVGHDISERKRNEVLLMNIARGVSAELGEAFFRSLVGHLARELGADFAFIGEVVPPANDRVRTLACVMDGAIGENFEYRLEGSPCINAITKRGTVVYPQGVAELFPRDGGLKKRGIQAYVGTSLHAADGSALGVLVVMHRKPVERGAFWASMIEIFGARAAAEIERSRAEALVRQTNASLEQIVRERTAQLEDANRELESYNYSISHDLRQPLNAIAGFSELLRDSGAGALDRAADDYLREIENNSVRMEQMIDALLALSQAGRGALNESEVDANALVESVLRDLAAARPLAAEFVVGELPRARGDPVLLRQVWANLIGNALKYSGSAASPRVEIGGSSRPGMVEYTVQRRRPGDCAKNRAAAWWDDQRGVRARQGGDFPFYPGGVNFLQPAAGLSDCP